MSIVFSADQAAAALWTYGEDELVDRATRLTDAELHELWARAGSYSTADHGLPLTSRLVLDKGVAQRRSGRQPPEIDRRIEVDDAVLGEPQRDGGREVS